MKLVVFDLDDTIAPIGKNVASDNVKQLRILEDLGNTIAICSGKPVFYLCGFVRQLGLNNPILVGENGAVIQFGIDLPPKKYYVQKCSNKALKFIDKISRDIISLLPEIWCQPNIIGFTPFPSNTYEFDIIQNYLDKNPHYLEFIDIYRHSDSFDIVPKGICKKQGLTTVGEILGIPANNTVCVGNGVNDYPMFEYASISIGVNVPNPDRVDMNFTHITDALNYLINVEEKNRLCN